MGKAAISTPLTFTTSESMEGALRAFDEETSPAILLGRGWWHRSTMRQTNRRISWVWFAVMAAATLLGSGEGMSGSPLAYQKAIDVAGMLATSFFLIHSAIALWVVGWPPRRRTFYSWSLCAGYVALPCALLAFFLPLTERRILSSATWVLVTPHILLGAWHGLRRLDLHAWQRIPLVGLLALLILTLIFQVR
jgi:hypothetical protein